MKSLAIKLTVAILTFAVGVTSASWRFIKDRDHKLQQPTTPAMELSAPAIFISKDIDWKLPPKEIVEEMGLFYDGSGSIMVLDPSGALSVIRCDLRKDAETGQLSLNGVVSFSVDKGTWSRNADGSITTVSRFCVSPMGMSPHPSTTDRVMTFVREFPNRDVLVSQDEGFVPIPSDFRDLDGINFMLKCACEK